MNNPRERRPRSVLLGASASILLSGMAVAVLAQAVVSFGATADTLRSSAELALGIVLCLSAGAAVSHVLSTNGRFMAAIQQPSRLDLWEAFVPYYRKLLGVVMLLVGLIADSAAGFMVLNGAVISGLLLHLPAATIWAIGLGSLEGHAPTHVLRLLVARLKRRHQAHLADSQPADLPLLNWSGWAVTSFLLGLVLFPGLGPLGCSLAFGLAYLRPRPHPEYTRVSVQAPSPTVQARHNGKIDPLLDLEIEPLVDVLRHADTGLRRAAIEVLGRKPTRETVQLMRGLLTDSNPEVRNDAAVTLTRIENDLNRDLRKVIAQAKEHPADAQCCGNLGAAYYHYANSDLLDEVSARFYLTQARDTLQQAITMDQGQAEFWMNLARVEHVLNETLAALQAVEQVLKLKPAGVEAYLLGMELAISQQCWDKLLAFAAQARIHAVDHSEIRELLNWWAEAQPEMGTGALA